MKRKDLIGYLTGLILFVILIPLLMWRISGEVHPNLFRIFCFAVLAVIGIGLSLWSILYMRLVGKGNPLDAFNHEVAPRTSRLMTDGPYRLCRNPMLFGVIVYYLGLLIFLNSLKAIAVFILFLIIMMIQVHFEEKRLLQDFGDAYLKYRSETKKIIPFIW